MDGSILNEFTSKQCSFDYFTGKPEKACRFFPRMKSNKASASLMFMQYLESVSSAEQNFSPASLLFCWFFFAVQV